MGLSICVLYSSDPELYNKLKLKKLKSLLRTLRYILSIYAAQMDISHLSQYLAFCDSMCSEEVTFFEMNLLSIPPERGTIQP